MLEVIVTIVSKLVYFTFLRDVNNLLYLGAIIHSLSTSRKKLYAKWVKISHSTSWLQPKQLPQRYRHIRSYYLYHPCLVYLPTFGWFFMVFMEVNIPYMDDIRVSTCSPHPHPKRKKLILKHIPQLLLRWIISQRSEWCEMWPTWEVVAWGAFLASEP